MAGQEWLNWAFYLWILHSRSWWFDPIMKTESLDPRHPIFPSTLDAISWPRHVGSLVRKTFFHGPGLEVDSHGGYAAVGPN
jgi:hypothetical protein